MGVHLRCVEGDVISDEPIDIRMQHAAENLRSLAGLPAHVARELLVRFADEVTAWYIEVRRMRLTLDEIADDAREQEQISLSNAQAQLAFLVRCHGQLDHIVATHAERRE